MVKRSQIRSPDFATVVSIYQIRNAGEKQFSSILRECSVAGERIQKRDVFTSGEYFRPGILSHCNSLKQIELFDLFSPLFDEFLNGQIISRVFPFRDYPLIYVLYLFEKAIEWRWMVMGEDRDRSGRNQQFRNLRVADIRVYSMKS
jgi:hypothetical protein